MVTLISWSFLHLVCRGLHATSATASACTAIISVAEYRPALWLSIAVCVVGSCACLMLQVRVCASDPIFRMFSLCSRRDALTRHDESRSHTLAMHETVLYSVVQDRGSNSRPTRRYCCQSVRQQDRHFDRHPHSSQKQYPHAVSLLVSTVCLARVVSHAYTPCHACISHCVRKCSRAVWLSGCCRYAVCCMLYAICYMLYAACCILFCSVLYYVNERVAYFFDMVFRSCNHTYLPPHTI